MIFFSYFFLLALGCIAGSFLGMLTYRLPRRLPLTGRSFCDHCRRQISWYENLPLAAYFVIKKCRNCQRPISVRYPLIEALTAVLFVLIGYSPYLLLVSLVLLSLAIIDLEHQILPDHLTLLLGIFLLAPLVLLPSPGLFIHLLWGYLAFLFFLAIYLVTRGRGMGFGDVKLAFVMGAFLGSPGTFVWLFVSFLLGASVGLVLLLTKKAKPRAQVPFGPYLILGFVIAHFWQEEISGWYLGFLQ